jgi:hypothetical protein
MCICSPTAQFSQPPLAVLPTILIQVSLQQKLCESVITLQYVQPNSFSHQSIMLPTKTPMQEVKTVSVRVLLMQPTDPHSLYMMDRRKFTEQFHSTTSSWHGAY